LLSELIEYSEKQDKERRCCAGAWHDSAVYSTMAQRSPHITQEKSEERSANGNKQWPKHVTSTGRNSETGMVWLN